MPHCERGLRNGLGGKWLKDPHPQSLYGAHSVVNLEGQEPGLKFQCTRKYKPVEFVSGSSYLSAVLSPRKSIVTTPHYSRPKMENEQQTRIMLHVIAINNELKLDKISQ